MSLSEYKQNNPRQKERMNDWVHEREKREREWCEVTTFLVINNNQKSESIFWQKIEKQNKKKSQNENKISNSRLATQKLIGS